MLENGELLTIKAFAAEFESWLDRYHNNIHSGLRDQGEPNPRPIEVFLNAERYQKAAPPYEYAVSLLGKVEERRVSSVGIQIRGRLYSSPELGRYMGEKVTVRYNESDIECVCVYNTETGKRICRAYTYDYAHADAELDDENMIRHFKEQSHQLKQAKTELMKLRRSYDDVITPELADAPDKVIALPQDEQYRINALERNTVKKSPEKKQEQSDFVKRQAAKVYEQLAKLG